MENFLKMDQTTERSCRQALKSIGIRPGKQTTLIGVLSCIGGEIWDGNPFHTTLEWLADKFEMSISAIKGWFSTLDLSGILIKTSRGCLGIALRWTLPPPTTYRKSVGEPRTDREKAARIRRKEAEEAGKIREDADVYERVVRTRMTEPEIKRTLEREEKREEEARRLEAVKKKAAAEAQEEREEISRYAELGQVEQQEIREAALSQLTEDMRHAAERDNSFALDHLNEKIAVVMRERSSDAATVEEPEPEGDDSAEDSEGDSLENLLAELRARRNPEHAAEVEASAEQISAPETAEPAAETSEEVSEADHDAIVPETDSANEEEEDADKISEAPKPASKASCQARATPPRPGCDSAAPRQKIELRFRRRTEEERRERQLRAIWRDKVGGELAPEKLGGKLKKLYEQLKEKLGA